MDMKLFCRVRPSTDLEKQAGLKIALTSCKKVSNFAKFEHVFMPADNQDVVSSHIKPIARQVFMGHNVCIISYGQAASGKTFTISGEVQQKGLLYKVVEDLQRRCKNVASPKSLSVSLLEVRQELIKDMLVSNSRRLQIKEGKVVGLTSLPIQGVDQLWNLLESSPKDSSSSSHRLVRVSVQRTSSKSVSSVSTNATNHLWFVDMAGSQVDGGRGVAKSFTALEDVLSACASGDRTKIPYRNSPLSHLLFEDCSKIGLIFNVSPTYLDLNDSLCTFSFARRITGCLRKKKTMKSPLKRYREWREDVKRFPFDKRFNPCEPQDPLGYMYNGLLTAATQTLFRGAEYWSRRSPKFVDGCNVLATTVQNRSADLAMFVISEESPYSIRKRYEGVGGLYSITRFLIPVLVTVGVMLHNNRSENGKKKSETERFEKMTSDLGKLETQSLQSFKTVQESIDKLNESIAELKEPKKSRFFF